MARSRYPDPACGTSWHAGLVARYWLESIAGFPARSRSPANTAIAIRSPIRRRWSSPSRSPAKPPIPWPPCSTPSASAWDVRWPSVTFPNPRWSGNRPALHHPRRPEIGVASTKAFTTQLAALFLLTLVLAKLRNRLDAATEAKEMKACVTCPAVQKVLALEPRSRPGPAPTSSIPCSSVARPALPDRAGRCAEAQGNILHPRRGLPGRRTQARATGAGRQGDAGHCRRPERCPAGETEVEPAGSPLRGGELFVFADADSEIAASEGVHVLRLPEHYGALSALLHVVPLQLLSYHVALVKGTDGTNRAISRRA